MSKITKINHVLIAGAGLSGPALALSLARQGIRSTIFEIRSEPSKAGGSITLTSRAIKALDQSTNVFNKLKEVGFSYTQMAAFDDEGYRYGSIVVGNEEVEGYPALRIMRHELSGILLESCSEMDKLVSVKWGAECTNIQESGEGVTATFKDGTTLKGEPQFPELDTSVTLNIHRRRADRLRRYPFKSPRLHRPRRPPPTDFLRTMYRKRIPPRFQHHPSRRLPFQFLHRHRSRIPHGRTY